jgi:predicted alpha/beta superfamily hydrolase
MTISMSPAQEPMPKINDLTIGVSRTIHSDILNEDRRLNIYLPHNYDEEKAYPVIYLLDGSIDEDFLHIVGLVQFFKLQFQMPDHIVVGIANVDRKRDFTFHTDLEDLKQDFPTSGHSALFLDFLEKELLPFISTKYKTTETKYLIGQSLGGLLASEVLLKRPTLFSHYLIISPSLWWDNESMLKQAPILLAAQSTMPEYVYLAVGKKEHPVMRKEAKKLHKHLKNAPLTPNRMDLLVMKKEDHATILHNSIYEAFLRLFPMPE